MLPPERKRKLNPMLMKVIVISVAIHVVAAFVAGVITVATIVIQEDAQFEEPPAVVEEEPPPPVKVKITPPPPKQQPQRLSLKPIANIAIANVDVDLPNMGDTFTVSAGLGGTGGSLLGGAGRGTGIGLKMPEINFFGAKSRGEKIIFIVHFGPATTSGAGKSVPYTRMTAFTIRKRLEEMVQNMPDQALFNVAAFWASHCTPFSPKMISANPSNKQQLMNWMAPVNPVEGTSKTYGSGFDSGFNKRLKQLAWPQRLDSNMPSFGPAWYYDYRTPEDVNSKYLPQYKKGTYHWGRGLVWALTTQKPDTIFILTTNYLPGDKDAPNHPKDIATAYQKICEDLYDPANLKHPTVNVVVLAPAGSKPEGAQRVLDERFKPLIRASKGKGSVIADIRKYMSPEEKRRLETYKPPAKSKKKKNNQN